MDDARPALAPDPTLLPAELRRPLVEGVIVAHRPGPVAWAAWSFGLTWLLALARWSPWLVGVGGVFRAVPAEAALVLLATLVAALLLIQVGLLRGRLAAWAAAVNLALVPVGLLGYWVVTLHAAGVAPFGILGLAWNEAAGAAVALLTLILLLLPDSRRWFWRASALRSQARSLSPIPPPVRPT